RRRRPPALRGTAAAPAARRGGTRRAPCACRSAGGDARRAAAGWRGAGQRQGRTGFATAAANRCRGRSRRRTIDMRSFATSEAPHLPARTSVQGVMRQVLLALVPGVVAQVWYFGVGVLLQVALACAFALALEAAMLRLRGQPLRPFATDLSAPVSAVLFALCIPPLAPWWVALIGMATAMVFAKHLYGGIGLNLFNPAMAGYAA